MNRQDKKALILMILGLFVFSVTSLIDPMPKSGIDVEILSTFGLIVSLIMIFGGLLMFVLSE